jgi:hypothetical protein
MQIKPMAVIKSVVPSLFFFVLGLSVSYIVAIVLGVMVFSSMQGDDEIESAVF